jgi:hypothetical protein
MLFLAILGGLITLALVFSMHLVMMVDGIDQSRPKAVKK